MAYPSTITATLLTINMIIAVAFIGRQNEPLFFYSVPEETGIAGQKFSSNLNMQMIVHSSLDIVEERKRKTSSSAPSTFDLYLGQLLQVDEYKVFGHYSNTHMKTIIVCDAATDASDGATKDIILSLRNLYILAVQNPFQITEGSLTSVKLKNRIQQTFASFNNKVTHQQRNNG